MENKQFRLKSFQDERGNHDADIFVFQNAGFILHILNYTHIYYVDESFFLKSGQKWWFIIAYVFSELSNVVAARLLENVAANTVVTFLSTDYVNSVLQSLKMSNRARNKFRLVAETIIILWHSG